MIFFEENYNQEKADRYLDLLLELSSKVIINHELGHVLNGHLKYKNSIENNSECCMFMNSNENELPPIDSQLLEMDADTFAATTLVGIMIYDDNIKIFNNNIPNLIKNKSHAIELCVIASTIVFSIQGLGHKREISNLCDLKYLPLRTRQDYYMRCILNAHKNINPNKELRFDIKFLREIVPSIEEYVNLYNQEVLGFSSQDYSSVNNMEELNEIHLEHCNYLDSGLKMKYSPTDKPGNRIKKITTTEGNSIDLNKSYSIAVMDYSVPDKYIKKCDKTNIKITDIITEYVEKQKSVSPSEDKRFIVARP